ncbi:MAG: Txe/YoeB family addiction module toxin [Gracilibacteraceae bacterium]|jgi:toxin YoeB|nr:Txe/YoeB family addiction module toxin [Gracilibacteraceae bacterium]
MKINFTETGWCEYLYWEGQDRKTLKRINNLLEDIERNGQDGIGKPEPLRNDMSGWWSRRIDDKNRLVYRLIGNEAVEISQCKGHYGDK